MNGSFDIQGYLARGIDNFVRDVLKATLKNPRESAFMLKFAAAAKMYAFLTLGADKGVVVDD